MWSERSRVKGCWVGRGILLSLSEDGSFSSEDSLQIAVAKGFFTSNVAGGKLKEDIKDSKSGLLQVAWLTFKESMVEILGTKPESLPFVPLHGLRNGVQHIHLQQPFSPYWRWDSSQVSLQIPYAISDIKTIGFSTNIKRSPNFKTHRIYPYKVIHQCFVDLTENLNLVGWNAWNVWNVRRKFGDFVSHLNSMPWGHSPHISGSIGWQWWHDLMFDGSWAKNQTQTVDSHVNHANHFRFQFPFLDMRCFFKVLVSFFSSFMSQNSEKMSLLVRFFGETPSDHIVTCLLLCAARDLKSSQCAVHVVGPVHCTQRKGHSSRRNIFIYINSWFLKYHATWEIKYLLLATYAIVNLYWVSLWWFYSPHVLGICNLSEELLVFQHPVNT